MGFHVKQLEKSLARKMRMNEENLLCAGSIIRVMRGNNTVLERAQGYANIGRRTPVQADSIFRIYSMTKPVTMVALMQLYERGLIFPEDELRKFFPAAADLRVAVDTPTGVVMEPQKRQVTIHDLYTMTSGISYGGDEDAGARLMEDAFRRYEGKPMALEDMVNVIAREAGLSFQPGARWKYGYSHDILGAVIEKVSGMPLYDYMRKYIFDPLGMADTGFFVPPESVNRFVTAYTVANGAYASMANEAFAQEQFLHKPWLASGGGGLVSTLDDYARFCQMLLQGGELRGERLLSRKTVAMMAKNHLTDAQMATYSWRDRGYGYGVGMRTMERPLALNGSVGEFGWDGMMGTWMAVDPTENLAVVYMQNMYPHNTNGFRLMPLIYAALD